jgi:predicted transcriptional regulator
MLNYQKFNEEGHIMGERKTFSVRIQPDVMKALRILAVEKEVTLSELLEEAIRAMLKKEGSGEKSKAKKR